MAKRFFGTDGVRGHANRWPMSAETILALGRAAGAVLRRRSPGKKRVVIGKDTRLSCYMVENALIAGLSSMGVDTLMVGPLPTPGVAYITRAWRADAGIVISASHNPYYDNGIKFFSTEGYKLEDAFQQEVEQTIADRSYEQMLPPDNELGKNGRIDDAQGRYVEFVKASFPRGLSLRDFSMVVDCGHGATYRVAPLAFGELGARLHCIGVKPDGININEGYGTLHPEAMMAKIVETGAQVGVAFDGDGDRVIMADEKGQLVDGDVILAICARDLKERGLLPQNQIVGTVMTNLGVIKTLAQLGIGVHCTKVGDRHVFRGMQNEGVVLGGEQSGHMIFLDHNTTGDGLVAAMQVLSIMVRTGTPLSELAAFVKQYPQKLINVPVSNRPPLDEVAAVKRCLDEAEAELGDEGRVLVRYSGTEPLCRAMVEGKEIALVERLANKIAETISQEIGA